MSFSRRGEVYQRATRLCAVEYEVRKIEEFRTVQTLSGRKERISVGSKYEGTIRILDSRDNSWIDSGDTFILLQLDVGPNQHDDVQVDSNERKVGFYWKGGMIDPFGTEYDVVFMEKPWGE